MARGDAAVFSISAALATVVAAALTYSLLVLDRGPSALVSQSTDTSWLVLTWGASFCAANPSDEVCATGEIERMGQTLILHGLWPQPRDNQYCGVPSSLVDRARKGRGDLPPLELSTGTRASLQQTMAGSATMAAHEWYAHGTCSGATTEAYFGDAVVLTDQVRDVLDPLFRDSVGGNLSLTAVRGRVDEQFGAGAGDRVALSCRKVTGEGALVVDVRVSLPPVTALHAVDGSMNLGKLLLEAPALDGDCRHGRVS